MSSSPSSAPSRGQAGRAAREYVLAEFARLRACGQARLPGIRRLAASAGVSHVTMWKAVHQLCLERTLVVSQAGVTLGDRCPEPPLPSAAAPPEVVARWQAVRTRIARDLLAGAPGPGGALPSQKELQARYGVAFATVQKALRSLAEGGLIEPFGRGYRVPDLAGWRSSRSVVYIGKTQRMDPLSELSPRALEIWRALEESSARCGVPLRVDTVERHLTESERALTARGYVVRNLDLSPELAQRLLRNLRSTGLPVALVDELGWAGAPGRDRGWSGLGVFSIAHSAASGAEVGLYLRLLGHRRIAFISPLHGAHWIQHRFEGLCEVFVRAGVPDAVRHYASNDWPSHQALRDHLARSSEMRTITRAFRRLARSIGTYGDPGALAPAVALDYVLERSIDRHLERLFRRALRDGATAWVGLNDQVALSALRFLSRRGIPVPGAISIVGFDNTAPAMTAGLTSYDFNLRALADALLAHALGQSHGKAPGARDSFDIPGFLVRRDSAAARK